MKKILIILTLLALNFIQAATLTLNQTIYTPTDGLPIEVEFKEMTGQNKDWIAIYPAGTNNSWKNVVAWKWTDDKMSGKVILAKWKKRSKMRNGKYEVRAFYNNSYKMEAKVAFEIKGEDPRKEELTLPKTKYSTSDTITVKFKNMTNQNQDWIAIYPAKANNAWKNVIDWAWTDDKISGELTFDSLPTGKYEIRAFYDNSARTVYARISFEVISQSTNAVKIALNSTKLSLNIDYTNPNYNLPLDSKDWIGIYKKEDSVAWKNVLKWKWMRDIRNYTAGDATFKYKSFKKDLATGKYEARFFKNNSFTLDTAFEFTVSDDGSSNDEEIEYAKRHCPNSPNELVICKENNMAYVISASFMSNDIYEVNLVTNSKKLIDRIDTHSAHSKIVSKFVPIKNTSLIRVENSFRQGSSDYIDEIHFYANGKRQLYLSYDRTNDYGSSYTKVETFDNGQKLRVLYYYYQTGEENENYEDIYDISDVSNVKRISETRL